jgi:hypothetical protein
MATRIDLGQLRQLLGGGARLVEVLPAAINLPLKQLDATTTARLDRTGAMVVYCWDSL